MVDDVPRDENTETRPIAVQRKATELRAKAGRTDTVRRWFLIAGSGVLVIVIAVGLVLGLISSSTSDASPENMVNGGVVIGANLAAGSSSPEASASKSPIVSVVAYLDYDCTDCAGFFSANEEQLRGWVSSGRISLTIVPIAYTASQYSVAAANAAACVATYEPDSFFNFNEAMFQTTSDATLKRDTEQIVQLASQASGTNDDALSSCIRDETYKAWVVKNTNQALASTGASSSVLVTGVPEIFVNSQQFSGLMTDPIAFSTFVFRNETSSPSASVSG